MSEWVVRIKGWKTAILDKPETSQAVEELASQIEKLFPAENRPIIKLAKDLGIVVVECDDVAGEKLWQLSGAERAYKAPYRGPLKAPRL